MAIDLEAIRKKVSELQGGKRNSRVQLWKPGPGSYRVRGLPWPSSNPGEPFKELWFYYIGENSGMLSPKQYGKPDPINDLISELYKSGTPDDRELAKKLRAKMRTYMPIIVREENGVKKTGEPEVLVWSFGKLVYQRLLNFFLNEEIGDFLDPQDGFDLDVTLSKIDGKRFLDTTVDVARRPSAISSDPEAIKKILSAIPNLDDMYTLKTPEQMEAVLNSWLNGDTNSGDDGSTGTTRSKPSSDALDDLVNEVKSDNKPKKAAVKKKSSKKDAESVDDDFDTKSDVPSSLNDAFDELMNDD